MQETWVQSLVRQRRSHCHGSTKPVHHNPRSHAPEPGDATPEPTLQSQEMRPQSPCSMLQSRKTPQPPSPHSRAGRCDSRAHAPEPGDATPKPMLQSQETRPLSPCSMLQSRKTPQPPSPHSRAGRCHSRAHGPTAAAPPQRGHRSELPGTVPGEWLPPSPTRESCTVMKTQHSQK